jgi:acetyltransferase
VQAKRLLAAYGIPVVRTEIASDAEHAVALAAEIGYPVALKILSPDIVHKSDAGGVALHLDNAEQLREAARTMLSRVSVRSQARPLRIEGFTVQAMIERGADHELILGCTLDPIFGPVIMFGQGGTAVEVIRDRAFALPPMNTIVAKDLIGRTRIAKLLAGYRNVPAVDEPALLNALVALSQLVCDHAEIQELDINPLLASARGVVTLDARVRVQRSPPSGEQRLAIRPYPRQLEETAQFDGQKFLLRPIRPEDEPAHREFLARLAPEDTYFRFFQVIKTWPHAQLARLTQIDYDREMAFVAVTTVAEKAEILGVARAVTDPDNTRAEFAIIVRSDLKARGLGHQLMQKLVRYCQARGTRELFGYVLPDNLRMLALGKTLGFARKPNDEGIIELALRLD